MHLHDHVYAILIYYDSVSLDQFSRNQLPSDQLSWDQFATRLTKFYILKKSWNMYLTWSPVWYFMASRKSLRLYCPFLTKDTSFPALFDAWSCGWLCSMHVTSTASPTDVALPLSPALWKLHLHAKHLTFSSLADHIIFASSESIVFPLLWVSVNSAVVVVLNDVATNKIKNISTIFQQE